VDKTHYFEQQDNNELVDRPAADNNKALHDGHSIASASEHKSEPPLESHSITAGETCGDTLEGHSSVAAGASNILEGPSMVGEQSSSQYEEDFDRLDGGSMTSQNTSNVHQSAALESSVGSVAVGESALEGSSEGAASAVAEEVRSNVSPSKSVAEDSSSAVMYNDDFAEESIAASIHSNAKGNQPSEQEVPGKDAKIAELVTSTQPDVVQAAQQEAKSEEAETASTQAGQVPTSVHHSSVPAVDSPPVSVFESVHKEFSDEGIAAVPVSNEQRSEVKAVNAAKSGDDDDLYNDDAFESGSVAKESAAEGKGKSATDADASNFVGVHNRADKKDVLDEKTEKVAASTTISVTAPDAAADKNVDHAEGDETRGNDDSNSSATADRSNIDSPKGAASTTTMHNGVAASSAPATESPNVKSPEKSNNSKITKKDSFDDYEVDFD
jgi:hypothetical protein